MQTSTTFLRRSMSAVRNSLWVAASSGNSNMPLHGRNGHLCCTTRVQEPATQNEQSFGRLRHAVVYYLVGKKFKEGEKEEVRGRNKELKKGEKRGERKEEAKVEGTHAPQRRDNHSKRKEETGFNE